MASSRSRGAFGCTYKSCLATFESEKLMKRHKASDPEHDYCRICDLDFEDELGFLKHKIESSSHICCPMCGEDFKSEGGKDRHVRQTHAAEQNLECAGCQKIFPRAGALIEHIEKRRCAGITLEEFKDRRMQKELVSAYLDDGPGAGMFTEPPSVNGGVPIGGASSDGGLSIVGGGCLLDDDNLPAGDLMEPLIKSDGVGPDLGAEKSKEKVWPKLRPVSPTNEDWEGNLLGGVESLSVRDKNSPWTSSSASQKLFPNAPDTPATEEYALGLAKPGGPRPPDAFLRPDWHPDAPGFTCQDFFDPLSEKYFCPYYMCGKNYRQGAQLEAHLKSDKHLKASLECPGCFRKFVTHTALVQHCESASTRCKINQTHSYGKYIDKVSGGYIEVRGRHTDGTVKYMKPENMGAKW